MKFLGKRVPSVRLLTPFSLAQPTRCSSALPEVQNLLSFCSSGDIVHGLCVHSPIIKLYLWVDGTCLLLANSLLSLYSRCCSPHEARKLFDDMPHRDIVSWTAIISAYARTNKHEEALCVFQELRRVAPELAPNQFTFSRVLHCASSLRELLFGSSLHAQIIKCGFLANTILSTTIIDLYARCSSSLTEASRVFTDIGISRDAVLWTTMISAHVQAEDWCRALQLYASMISSRASPNEFTFAKLLQACSSLGSHYGDMIHAHIITWGVQLNLILKTALVNMYSNLSKMTEALIVFNQTLDSDVVLWTSLITGYTHAGDYNAAILAFRNMELVGVSPSSYTYAGLLSACSSVAVPELGKQLHSRAVKVGLQHDVSVGNALVDLYTRCSTELCEALRAFEEIFEPNVVSWTAFIACLSCYERSDEAFEAFTEMRLAGIQPNSFTLSTVFAACESLQVLPYAEKLHAYGLQTGSIYSDIIVGNSLVDLYTRFGRVDDAWKVSMAMPLRDVFTYTSLASGLNQMGFHRRALGMINYMHNEDIKMDGFSLASFLCASAGIAPADCGKQLHCHSVKCGLISWISVSNALIDMYGKSGSIEEAHRVFKAMEKPNVVSWNGFISGLASNGQFSEALSAFEDMRLAGTEPDDITFLLVLYACSHGGMLDLGVDYFEAMTKVYDVVPQLDHYVCLVDMLGRAGRLEEASAVIEGMPFRPDALIYKTLLSACRVHGNVVLAECTAGRALEQETWDPAVYVLLAGIYDDAGRLDLAEQTRRTLRERVPNKSPGQSWVVKQKT